MASRKLEPRVKVCGLTAVADLEVALAAGAEAIGLVAHPGSARHLEVAAMQELCAHIPAPIAAVGVFVDRSPTELLDFVPAVGLTAVQLCGAERAEDWRAFPWPILRRLPVSAGAEAELERWRGIATLYVLDTPNVPGGSGLLVDFERARALARVAPCLLAGGLDPGNVALAIRRVRPLGVDASSRLECTPGRKDPQRLRAFVRTALSTFSEGEQ